MAPGAAGPEAARERRIRLAIRVVVLVTLLLRLLLIASVSATIPSALQTPDTGTYLRPAHALLAAGTFSPSVAAAPEPEVVRTPGYPVFLAGLIALFGDRLWVFAAASALLGAATAFVLARLADSLFGSVASLAAVVLYSVEVSTFRYGTMVMSEALFTFLLLAGLALAAGAPPGPGPARAFAAGTCLAAATLVRPILCYALPFAVLALAWGGGWAPGSRRRAAATGLAALLPVVLLVGGWQLRNLARTGDAALSQVASANLLFSRAGAVVAARDGIPLLEAQRRLGWDEFVFRFGHVEKESDVFSGTSYAAEFPESSRQSVVELARSYRARALAIFRESPGLTAWLHLKGLGLFFASPIPITWAYQFRTFHPAPDMIDAILTGRLGRTLGLLYERHRGLFLATLAAYLPLLLLYALAAVGLAKTPFERRPLAHVALAGTLLYFTAVMAAPEAVDDRYRVPILPILCVYAGHAASALRPRI